MSKSGHLQCENKTRLIPELPNDITHLIFSYLPAYKKRGALSIGLVNRAWAKANCHRITIEDVIDSCRTFEDALNILADDALYDQLCFDDLLEIASYHPDLVKAILDANTAQEEKLKPLSLRQIAILIAKTEPLLLEMLNSPSYHTRWKSTHLVLLASHQIQAAHHILKNKEFIDKLTAAEIPTIFDKHKILQPLAYPLLQPKFKEKPILFAQCINTIEEVTELLKKAKGIPRSHLTIWALKFPEIARNIIKNPISCTSIPESEWFILACEFNFIAEHITKNPNLLSNKSLLYWYHIAINHEFFARYLMSSEVVEEFETDQLYGLAQKYPFFLNYIATTLPSKRKYSPKQLHDFGLLDENIAKIIIQDEILLSKMKKHHYLYQLLSKYHDLANDYLTNHPSTNLKAKAIICAGFAELSEVIFQEHCLELSQEALFILATRQPKIAEEIKQNPPLFNKLSDIQLLQIGHAHPAPWIFDYLHSLPDTHKRKSSKNTALLTELALSSFKTASFILNHIRFYKTLRANQLFRILVRHERLLPLVLKNPFLRSKLKISDLIILCDKIPLNVTAQLLDQNFVPEKSNTRFRKEISLSQVVHGKAKELVFSQKAAMAEKASSQTPPVKSEHSLKKLAEIASQEYSALSPIMENQKQVRLSR